MNYRELLAIDEGRRGAFGKFLFDYLKEQSVEARKTASRIIPESMRDMHDREHLLAKANAFEDLVNEIPHKIVEALKEAQKQETK